MKKTSILTLAILFSMLIRAQDDPSRSIRVYLNDGSIEDILLTNVDSIDFVEKTYNYTYVDLGLSVKWATCNIGADNPWNYGYYFAWGQTQPIDSSNSITTYGVYMMYPIVGNPDVDAATANWGTDWRLPSKDEIVELLDSCTIKWTTKYGVKGRLFTGPNGNSIFLPAGGTFNGSTYNHRGYYGYYWTYTTNENDNYAYVFSFSQNSYSSGFTSRNTGCLIRPVFNENNENSSTENTNDSTDVLAVSGEINGYEFVDLGLSVKWATRNIGADNPQDYGYYIPWGETEPVGTSDTNISTAEQQDTDEEIQGDSITFYDVATEKWGQTWRMPTDTEMQELLDSCTWRWTIKDLVYGYLVTGPSGKSIFLPPAGYYFTSYELLYEEGTYCYYWSSTQKDENHPFYLYYNKNKSGIGSSMGRVLGLSVRPVTE